MTRPLRIAFFVHEFPALSETFVLNQITGLLDLGHDITIFAVQPRDEMIVHHEIEYYRLREQTHYLGLPAGIARRFADGFLSIMRFGRKRPGAILRSLNLVRYGRDAVSLRLLFWTLCLRDQKPFDIVHCHFGPIGQLVAKLRDIGAVDGRLVTVFHGVDISAYVRDQPDYYRFLFATGDLFQPISRSWSQKLVELGCDPARIEVHHMGIDSGRYPFQARSFRTDRPLRILTVGRMVAKKGIADGLSAVAGLIEKGMNVSYTIVGDGPLRSNLERQVDELAIAPNVEFRGWCNQSVVAQLMAEHDVLLAPSVTSPEGDQEGIPVTLMEAMAAGMMIVSTRHSGIPELVEDECSGLIVPENDVLALTEALIRLVRHPDTWPKMSAAARAAVRNGFEIATLNEALVRRFRTLLDDGVPRKKRPMFVARRRFATN